MLLKNGYLLILGLFVLNRKTLVSGLYRALQPKLFEGKRQDNLQMLAAIQKNFPGGSPMLDYLKQSTLGTRAPLFSVINKKSSKRNSSDLMEDWLLMAQNEYGIQPSYLPLEVEFKTFFKTTVTKKGLLSPDDESTTHLTTTFSHNTKNYFKIPAKQKHPRISNDSLAVANTQLFYSILPKYLKRFSCEIYALVGDKRKLNICLKKALKAFYQNNYNLLHVSIAHWTFPDNRRVNNAGTYVNMLSSSTTDHLNKNSDYMLAPEAILNIGGTTDGVHLEFTSLEQKMDPNFAKPEVSLFFTPKLNPNSEDKPSYKDMFNMATQSLWPVSQGTVTQLSNENGHHTVQEDIGVEFKKLWQNLDYKTSKVTEHSNLLMPLNEHVQHALPSKSTFSAETTSVLRALLESAKTHTNKNEDHGIFSTPPHHHNEYEHIPKDLFNMETLTLWSTPQPVDLPHTNEKEYQTSPEDRSVAFSELGRQMVSTGLIAAENSSSAVSLNDHSEYTEVSKRLFSTETKTVIHNSTEVAKSQNHEYTKTFLDYFLAELAMFERDFSPGLSKSERYSFPAPGTSSLDYVHAAQDLLTNETQPALSKEQGAVTSHTNENCCPIATEDMSEEFRNLGQHFDSLKGNAAAQSASAGAFANPLNSQQEFTLAAAGQSSMKTKSILSDSYEAVMPQKNEDVAVGFITLEGQLNHNTVKTNEQNPKMFSSYPWYSPAPGDSFEMEAKLLRPKEKMILRHRNENGDQTFAKDMSLPFTTLVSNLDHMISLTGHSLTTSPLNSDSESRTIFKVQEMERKSFLSGSSETKKSSTTENVYHSTLPDVSLLQVFSILSQDFVHPTAETREQATSCSEPLHKESTFRKKSKDLEMETSSIFGVPGNITNTKENVKPTVAQNISTAQQFTALQKDLQLITETTEYGMSSVSLKSDSEIKSTMKELKIEAKSELMNHQENEETSKDYSFSDDMEEIFTIPKNNETNKHLFVSSGRQAQREAIEITPEIKLFQVTEVTTKRKVDIVNFVENELNQTTEDINTFPGEFQVKGLKVVIIPITEKENSTSVTTFPILIQSTNGLINSGPLHQTVTSGERKSESTSSISQSETSAESPLITSLVSSYHHHSDEEDNVTIGETLELIIHFDISTTSQSTNVEAISSTLSSRMQLIKPQRSRYRRKHSQYTKNRKLKRRNRHKYHKGTSLKKKKKWKRELKDYETMLLNYVNKHQPIKQRPKVNLQNNRNIMDGRQKRSFEEDTEVLPVRLQQKHKRKRLKKLKSVPTNGTGKRQSRMFRASNDKDRSISLPVGPFNNLASALFASAVVIGLIFFSCCLGLAWLVYKERKQSPVSIRILNGNAGPNRSTPSAYSGQPSYKHYHQRSKERFQNERTQEDRRSELSDWNQGQNERTQEDRRSEPSDWNQRQNERTQEDRRSEPSDRNQRQNERTQEDRRSEPSDRNQRQNERTQEDSRSEPSDWNQRQNERTQEDRRSSPSDRNQWQNERTQEDRRSSPSDRNQWQNERTQEDRRSSPSDRNQWQNERTQEDRRSSPSDRNQRQNERTQEDRRSEPSDRNQRQNERTQEDRRSEPSDWSQRQNERTQEDRRSEPSDWSQRQNERTQEDSRHKPSDWNQRQNERTQEDRRREPSDWNQRQNERTQEDRRREPLAGNQWQNERTQEDRRRERSDWNQQQNEHTQEDRQRELSDWNQRQNEHTQEHHRREPSDWNQGQNERTQEDRQRESSDWNQGQNEHTQEHHRREPSDWNQGQNERTQEHHRREPSDWNQRQNERTQEDHRREPSDWNQRQNERTQEDYRREPSDWNQRQNERTQEDRRHESSDWNEQQDLGHFVRSPRAPSRSPQKENEDTVPPMAPSLQIECSLKGPVGKGSSGNKRQIECFLKGPVGKGSSGNKRQPTLQSAKLESKEDEVRNDSCVTHAPKVQARKKFYNTSGTGPITFSKMRHINSSGKQYDVTFNRCDQKILECIEEQDGLFSSFSENLEDKCCSYELAGCLEDCKDYQVYTLQFSESGSQLLTEGFDSTRHRRKCPNSNGFQSSSVEQRILSDTPGQEFTSSYETSSSIRSYKLFPLCSADEDSISSTKSFSKCHRKRLQQSVSLSSTSISDDPYLHETASAR
ncbi:uncharacterized protein LOC144799531 isoform X14 [Lissotriton helveticus]